MRNHDAWLVDLDGTLYRARPVRLRMTWLLLWSGPRSVRTVRRFRLEHELLRRQNQPSQSSPFEDQLAGTATALRMAPEDVRRIVERFMFELPGRFLADYRRADLLREIASFREDGGRTALVSDYPACSKLEALGAKGLFDRVIASGEPGGPKRLKPAPDGLLLAAEALGVEPSRCLVLGDRLDADGAAAKAAGMEFRLVR